MGQLYGVVTGETASPPVILPGRAKARTRESIFRSCAVLAEAKRYHRGYGLPGSTLRVVSEMTAAVC